MRYINLFVPLSNWYILQREEEIKLILFAILKLQQWWLCLYLSDILVHRTTLIQFTCNEDIGHISLIPGQVRIQGIVFVICYSIDMQSFLKLNSPILLSCRYCVSEVFLRKVLLIRRHVSARGSEKVKGSWIIDKAIGKMAQWHSKASKGKSKMAFKGD